MKKNRHIKKPNKEKLNENPSTAIDPLWLFGLNYPKHSNPANHYTHKSKTFKRNKRKGF